MSSDILAKVWREAPYQEGSVVLVLMAIADEANDAGEAQVSMPSLAKKARQSERNVRYVLDRLERDGMITRLIRKGRTHRNAYQINLQNLQPLPVIEEKNRQKVQQFPVLASENLQNLQPLPVNGTLPQVSQVSPGPLPPLPSPSRQDQEIPPSPPKGGSSPKRGRPLPTDEDVQEVLTHLNTVAHKRCTDGQYIAARLKHGATVDDCKLVVDWFGAVKCAKWADGADYFNATTPFRPANFQGYLDEARVWDEQGRDSARDSPYLRDKRTAQRVVDMQQAAKDLQAKLTNPRNHGVLQ